jgi:hypothetical protein
VELADLGRTLLVVGGVVFLLGLVLVLAGNIPLLGRLPGDLSFEWGNIRVFLPLATMILISVVLTIILNLFSGGFRR